MSAIPIIPGHAYRVRHKGQTFIVLAPHSCRAISIMLEALL